MFIFAALSEAHVGCPLTACPAIEHPARCRAETFMIYAGTACMQCDKCIPKGIKFSLFSLCYQASICSCSVGPPVARFKIFTGICVHSFEKVEMAHCVFFGLSVRLSITYTIS